VRRLAQLAPTEWSLAGTCDADEAAVIATNAALHRLAGPDGTGHWSRWGWEQISRIEWKDSTSTLALVGQVPLLAGRVVLILPKPGPLVEVIRERLAWTTMLITYITLPSDGNLAVLVRRQPATDRMYWFLYPDASLEVNDAVVRSEIDDAVAALRADTGL
jgi:hypothetical protein